MRRRRDKAEISLDGIGSDNRQVYPKQSALMQKIDFIKEVDKLKTILRRTILFDKSRQENDAEHTWELAMMAVVLYDSVSPNTDLLRCLKMLLIHDVVEIYAGDTYAYDQTGIVDQHERERHSAEKIFGILPKSLGDEMLHLWEEFEARTTSEAKFARALDRLQPLLHNYYTDGVSWQKHAVTAPQVRYSMAVIRDSSDELGELVDSLIDDAVKRGFLPESLPS